MSQRYVLVYSNKFPIVKYVNILLSLFLTLNKGQYPTAQISEPEISHPQLPNVAHFYTLISFCTNYCSIILHYYHHDASTDSMIFNSIINPYMQEQTFKS